MANFECRAHPTMIFKTIKPYLFILILPFIRAIIQYITIKKVEGTIYFELLAIGFVAVSAFYGYRAMRIKIKNDRLIIEKGFFIKSRSVIEISRISSVSVGQNIFDAVTNAVTCIINTEAGGRKKSDFSIKLYKSDAKLLFYILYGTKNAKTKNFSPLDIALLAASTSSAVTGLVISIPIINKIDDLINIALSDTILKGISDFTKQFGGYLPPIVNMITIIIIIAYGISFIASFLKRIKFKLYMGESVVKIRTGLITRKQIAFKKKNINNICLEQTLLMRLFKRYSMRVSVGGYGDNKGEMATLVPITRRELLENYLKTFFRLSIDDKNKVKPTQNKIVLNRFMLIPYSVFLAVVGISSVVTIKLSRFSQIVWFLSAIIICIDVYYASICYHNYRHSKFCFDDIIMLSASKGFVIKELYCEKDKIGIIKISQTPADIRFDTCKLKIVVRSENADGIKIKNINLKETIESINKVYNIKLNA